MIDASFFAERAAYYVCPADTYEQLFKVDTSPFVKFDKNRGTSYINWMVLQILLKKHLPSVTPVYVGHNIVSNINMDEGEQLSAQVIVTFYDSESGLSTPLFMHPVMRKNRMNSADDEFNARSLSDAMVRAWSKAAALYFGLGANEWAKLDDLLEDFDDADDEDDDNVIEEEQEDEEQEEEPPVRKRSTRRSSLPRRGRR